MTEQPDQNAATDQDQSEGQVSEVQSFDGQETDAGDTVPEGGSDPGGAPKENERDNDQKK
ncbi:hypothetical protein [Nocardioides sp. Kera G14]|uniref:hypothetical protein n=1 Tax=Nocardioides sp. Kera G14 TaxID=2884264 RepID=UPI001D0FA2C6|nr:hypothetical protein [Nocardioides sp. Kera G14]UDY22914.1 hypothetical protein LH076_12660 [Nocardioides sp. Kera G14]